MHRLMAEGRGCVRDERDMIPQLHAEAAGRLDAGVRDHADEDEATYAVLLELEVEIGVGEPARSPMFMDNDIAWPRLEVAVECSTPAALGEDLRARAGQLVRRR